MQMCERLNYNKSITVKSEQKVQQTEVKHLQKFLQHQQKII